MIHFVWLFSCNLKHTVYNSPYATRKINDEAQKGISLLNLSQNYFKKIFFFQKIN